MLPVDAFICARHVATAQTPPGASASAARLSNCRLAIGSIFGSPLFARSFASALVVPLQKPNESFRMYSLNYSPIKRDCACRIVHSLVEGVEMIALAHFGQVMFFYVLRFILHFRFRKYVLANGTYPIWCKMKRVCEREDHDCEGKATRSFKQLYARPSAMPKLIGVDCQ